MKLPVSLLLLAPLAAAATDAAPPAGLPAFRAGMWSYSLTVNTYDSKTPRVKTMTRCSDPAAEMRGKWLKLEAQACKFSPLAHAGNRYSYHSSCTDKGRTLTMSSVIITDKDDAYRVETDSHTATQASREIVVARRIGDCPG